MRSLVHLQVEATAIAGLHVITMKQATDERGTVREFYRASALEASGLTMGPWAQINVTESRPGALRGMHGEAMTKLVAVVAGEAWGAYVDARFDSASYGRVEQLALRPGIGVLVPPGVCNGFQATGAQPVQYLYCFDREWAPGMAGVACNPLDPRLGIAWPVPVDPDDPAQISPKDRDAPAFDAIGAAR